MEIDLFEFGNTSKRQKCSKMIEPSTPHQNQTLKKKAEIVFKVKIKLMDE
jgi:hypothetical protein